MFERINSRWFVAGGIVLLLALASVACVQIAPRLLPTLGVTASPSDSAADIPITVDTTSTLAVGASPTPGPGQAVVKRGPISELLALNGRVAGSNEATLRFPASGQVSAVNAKLGDTVRQGDVLVETDAQDLKRQFAQAQAELENAAVRFQEANAQADADAAAQKQNAAQTARDTASQRQAVVNDSLSALHRAQTNLEKVQAGPSDSDVRAAQAAVTTAQLASQKADAELARLQRGADPTQINALQAQLSSAQSDYDKQEAALDTLTRGVDPATIRSAQRDVDRATATLKAAQAIPIDPKDPHVDKVRADKDVQVGAAQAAVLDAQDRLAALQQPPNSADVAVAKSNVQTAKTKLDVAKQALATAQGGPDQSTIDQAQAAADNAHLAQSNAEDHLADITSHPTPQELQAAQDQVRAAQAALDRANAIGTSGGVSANTNISTSYNLVLLEKELTRDQALVDSLTQGLASTQVTAPFNGVITRVQVHLGDKLTKDAPLLTLARPGEAIVEVNPTAADAAKIAVGQSATIAFDGKPMVFKGRVASVDDSSSPQAGHTVQLSIDWSAETAPYGALGQVQIQINQKPDALIVPKKAVHAAGQRKYVQVQTGTGRKLVNVEVGIVSVDLAEITSGLVEGQLVYVGP